MRLQQLRQAAADKFAKMQTISATAGARPMTPEERAAFDTLEVEHKELCADIAREERLQASIPSAPDANHEIVKAAEKAAGLSGNRIELGRELVADDPKRGFADHQDFLKAVMKTATTGRMDARLRPLQATQGSDEQGAYSDPYGGYLVPAAVAPGILMRDPEDDPFQGSTNVPMTAPSVSFNARVDNDHTSSVSGGFTVSRRPETVDGSASRMKFEQVTLRANEEFGGAFASETILTDSPSSFIAIIQAGFRDEFQANRLNEIVNGTGTGERQGYLTAGCLVSVSKETGQAAATIVKENIDKMEARCWRYNRAIWLANHNTRPQLKSLVQVVGTGGNSVPYFSSTPGGGGTLSGRPIHFTEFAKTIGTVGDLALLVPSEYLEGTYQSEQYAESIHVRFMGAERAFRFYRRNDGQWWWKAALTPKNGSTLSPVVVLATRS